MRAARIHAWGTAPVVEEVPEPVRGEGEVLVQVEAGGIGHLDATIASGEFAMKPTPPYIGGVEGAGTVLEADADSGLAPGTQVVLRGTGLGMLRDGTWTERVSVRRKAVTPLEAPLEPAVAASFFVPATTAYVALHDVGRVEKGEEVIVVGAAGAVGAMVAQQALAAGARVTGVVGRADQLADVPEGVEAVQLADAEALGKDRAASSSSTPSAARACSAAAGGCGRAGARSSSGTWRALGSNSTCRAGCWTRSRCCRSI